jgi:hypothetical protein
MRGVRCFLAQLRPPYRLATDSDEIVSPPLQ